jgi:hypothetical protein
LSSYKENKKQDPFPSFHPEAEDKDIDEYAPNTFLNSFERIKITSLPYSSHFSWNN